jgi:hypothetical protein
MQLKRLVVEFRGDDEYVVRTLYNTQEDGPNPGTKARARKVQELTRTGLHNALEALEGGAECVRTSVFTTRVDVPLATTSPTEAMLVKEA